MVWCELLVPFTSTVRPTFWDIQRLLILPDSRIQVGKAALNIYSCLGRAYRGDRAKLFPRAGGSLTGGQRAHRQLGRLRLGTWKEMCTQSVAQLHNKWPEKAVRSPSLEVSRTQPHQAMAGPALKVILEITQEGAHSCIQRTAGCPVPFSSVTRLEETCHPKLLCACVLREEPGLKCHLIRADR